MKDLITWTNRIVVFCLNTTILFVQAAITYTTFYLNYSKLQLFGGSLIPK